MERLTVQVDEKESLINRLRGEIEVHKLEMTDKVQLSEAKSTSLQSELNDLAARYQDALSKLMEAESSNSAMHDIDESLKAQAHELAKYQDRCKELEMEVLTLQASNWQSAMSSKEAFTSVKELNESLLAELDQERSKALELVDKVKEQSENTIKELKHEIGVKTSSIESLGFFCNSLQDELYSVLRSADTDTNSLTSTH
jgi:chromosome segregation ATPase